MPCSMRRIHLPSPVDEPASMGASKYSCTCREAELSPGPRVHAGPQQDHLPRQRAGTELAAQGLRDPAVEPPGPHGQPPCLRSSTYYCHSREWHHVPSPDKSCAATLYCMSDTTDVVRTKAFNQAHCKLLSLRHS